MRVTDLEGGHTPDRGPEEAGHVMQPLGRVQSLEPGRLVWRGVAQRPQRLETLADGVDVGHAHEYALGLSATLVIPTDTSGF